MARAAVGFRHRYRLKCLICTSMLVLLFLLPVAAAERNIDPRQPLRSGQVYTWAERMQLMQLGAKRKAEAIPHPGLWNDSAAADVLVFKGRRWVCARRAPDRTCSAVRLLAGGDPS